MYHNSYALTWSGRELVEMNRNYGQSVTSFTYNDEGIRTSKNVGGTVHAYVLNGSQIVSETWGQRMLLYLYDESGAPLGLQYRQSSYAAGVFDTFYFEKNIFGDIVAVYAENGQKIGTYTYDAWGNCTTTVASGNTTLQSTILRTYNPFRYRGYFYDTETGLYYLQSRYYNPATGRFLNADGYINANGDLIGFNMYAYCSNNPVMCVDPTGESITVAIIVGTLIGAAIGFGGTLYTDYSDDGEVFNGSVSAVGYIGNTAMGGLIGSFCGYFAPAISGFMSSSFTLGIPKMMGDVVAMQIVTVTGAQLVAGGAVIGIGATIVCAKHDSGRIRFNDGTGINPDTMKEFDNPNDARNYMKQIDDKAQKNVGIHGKKSKGWKKNHVVKKPKL